MSNQYEDLQVLECNNLSSSEYLGGNQESPSVFTNKLGSVVELKRGDKVSVDKAFLNEKGCGLPQGIEVKGINLPFNKTYTYTETRSAGVNYDYDKLEPSVYMECKPKEIKKTLRDDTMNIEMNYYTNTNGEGYFHLPRNYAHETQVRATPSDASKDITSNVAEAHEIWDTIDSVANGRVYYPVATAGGYKGSLCFNDYMWIFDGTTDAGYKDGGKEGYYKPTNDGGKMTIMTREINIFNSGDVDLPDDLGGGGETNGEELWQELATGTYADPIHSFDYNIRQDLLELKIDKGYNSPEDIALKLTEQLQEAEEPHDYYIEDTGDVPHFHQITQSTDTKTYKAMNSAWIGGTMKENFDEYMKTIIAQDSDKTINYFSSYQNIGVKRPDLFTLGRKVNTWDEQIFVKNTISDFDTTDPIVSSWEWESDAQIEPLLKKLSALFIAQANYPELFRDNDLIFGVPGSFSNPPTFDEKTARFLHMNRYNNTNGNIDNRLGYDNKVDKGANRCSIPWFFKYDTDFEGVMTNGLDITRLAYGFGTKTLMGDGKYYLTFHPELIDAVSGYIFEFQDGKTITADETLIGWDWNFNAYSTIALLLYSGYEKYTYDGLTQPGIVNFEFSVGADPKNITNIANVMSRVYVGGNNCAVEYADNHFNFKYLHTAENVGQSFDAGNTAVDDDKNVIDPIITDAGEECYKINKRLQLWNYCPDMRPYELTETINGIATNLAVADLTPKGPGEPQNLSHISKEDAKISQILKPLNKSIEPFSIMDSHCGVVLLMGNTFDENNWREGLSGVLGFTYEQFNPSVIDGSNNRNARIEYSNINKLKYLTTNSEIVSTDAKNYVLNRWGAIMYSTQVPIPCLITGWGQTGVNGKITRDHNAGYLYPNIVEQTQSIPVNSQELARTMIRPYYSIRSDLILQENNKYHGSLDSGARLPVIAIINKENGDGDFYFDGGEFEFTITQDINISSITTSIHDPDGSLANLNNGSGVIYKVSRIKNLDMSIIEEILKEKKS